MHSSSLVKHHSNCIEAFYDIPKFEIHKSYKMVCEKDPEQNIETEMADKADEVLKCEQTKADEILNKAQAKAIEILADAQKKEEAIISQARADSKELYKKTYQDAQSKGYSEGCERGMAEAEQKTEDIAAELLSISDQLINEREEFANSNRSLIIDLATQMARKIISDNFMVDKGAFLALFQRIVRDIPVADNLIVTVSDRDYKMMTFDSEKLLDIAKGFQTVEIRSDNTAEIGTLRLETPVMVLDASVNSQISLLKKELDDAI